MARISFLLTVVASLLLAGPAWGLTDYSNQDDWDSTCSSGDEQSPIVLDAAQKYCYGYKFFELECSNDSPDDASYLEDMEWEASFCQLTAEAHGIDVFDYTLSKIMVHHPAEHVLNYTTNTEVLVTPDVEVQFVFEPDDEDEDFKAVISILLSTFSDSEENGEFASALNSLVSQVLYSDGSSEVSTGGTFFTGTDYDPVYKMYSYWGINENEEHIDNDSPMLGHYFYAGSETKPSCSETVYWYVFREVLSIDSETLSMVQSLVSETYSGSDENARETQSSTGRDIRLEGCNPVYGYRVTMTYNFGFWLGLFFIIIYFGCTLSSDDLPPKEKDRSSVWTMHPYISIYRVGSEHYTKRSRWSIFWAQMLTMWTFLALFYGEIEAVDHWAIRLFVWTIIAIVISWIPSYYFGSVLRIAEKIHIEKYNDLERTDKEGREEIFNKFQKKNALAYFTFYASIFWWYVGCLVSMTWLMQDIGRLAGWVYIGSCLGGLFAELLIFDFIPVFLCMAYKPLIKFFMLRGYYFRQEEQFKMEKYDEEHPY
jgi:carbonic anhydrase